MTIEQRIAALERQKCCGKPKYFNTFADFPAEGSDNTLYVDEETASIYIWNGTEYISAGNSTDKFHSHIVATATYDALNPLAGWVAPSSPITGNTVEVKFTDGTIGNYTFDGTAWVLDFVDSTATVQRAWVKVGQTTAANQTQVTKDDNIYHNGDTTIGASTGNFKLNVQGSIWLENTNGSVNIGNYSGAGNNGFNNVNVGKFSGSNVTNSAVVNIGYAAGLNNTSDAVVNIGNQAGTTNTAINAINIGSQAGNENKGVHSINIGTDAGRYNDKGNSINIGYLSGRNSDGISAINIGTNAGNNSEGNNLISIGEQANQNANSPNTISIGQLSGQNNTSQNSLFVCSESGKNASGNYNIGIGYKAFETGSNEYNTAIGAFSLSKVTTRENVGVGAYTLKNTTTGIENTALGTSAGEFNITGERNVYLGWRAGFVNNGNANVLIGESASDQSLNASNNTGIGTRVLHDNGHGSRNVAVGEIALYYAQTMPVNIMVSGQQYMIVNPGSTNFTLLGSPNNNSLQVFTYNGALISGTGTVRDLTNFPNDNVAVGYAAGRYVGNGSGNVFIGNYAGDFVTAQGLSNKLFIANSNTSTPLIGGDFSTQELKVGGVQQFTVTFPISGTGVANGSLFKGVDGGLYYKGGSGTVTLMGPA